MRQLWYSFVNWLLAGRLREIARIERVLMRKIEQAEATPPTYTTIKTFKGANVDYYTFICQLINSDEFKYFCFDLRENVIRDMVKHDNATELTRTQGRLDMINIMSNYLIRYKTEYEAQVL